ncbi:MULTISPECIES: hypothetical protein [Streptomyces]|uniref:hypothetical protein n=1 Tax=Streptomyces TaxID=1883 RepID=UPI0036656114
MTDTLAPGARMNVALFSGGILAGVKPEVYRKDNGVLVVSGQPVFRSGTFRDSMGFQHTWEGLHMDQMVAHYKMLRDRGLFGDVPVRDGHPGFLVNGVPGAGGVVGWHTDLEARELETHTGSKETFLLAHYEITDPEARAKYENGTFRNRSSEVGEYTTNDEATFWPTYMGFAFVDIPAVEGLNSVSGFSKSNARSFVVLTEKGFSVSGTESSDKNAGQASGQSGVTPPTQGAPVTPPPAPVQQHAAPAQPFAFSINGQTITDPAAVQAHITGLETFRAESIAAGRVAFVTSMAKEGKILASQLESLTAFAKTLNDEQFQSWKTAMEAQPGSPVLANHAAGTGTQSEPGQPADEANAARVMTLRSVVSMHQSRGASPDEIKASASYKELVALDPTAAI